MSSPKSLKSPKSPKIGRHVSLSKDFHSSISFHYETHKSYGGKTNAFQMFMKSPQKFSLSKLTDADATKSKDYVITNNIYLVSHSAYICNIGKPLDLNSYQIKMIVDDIKTIERIGGVGTVVHVGKACEISQEECLSNMVKFTTQVIDATPDNKAFFILETAAGQGTEACVTLEALAEYHKCIPKAYHSRLRYCIDTCHIFAAGYDIRTEKGALEYINKFDDLIGWNFVELIHFNDSKRDLGSKKDRHENIGEGFIMKDYVATLASPSAPESKTPRPHSGLETFAIIATQTDKAIVLETPCGGKDAFDEIQRVFKWIKEYK